MRVILFELGPIKIYGYGLMMALGIVAAVVVTCFRAKKYYNIDPDLYFAGGLIGIISGLVGAKLMYWIVEIKAIIENPKILLDIGSGFVVYGGVLLGVLVPIIYLRKFKKTTALDKLDLAMPGISIGQFFGRIGCFLAGCCYGKPVPEGAWYGIVFPEGCDAPAGIALYPTQLLSALGNLLLAAFLIWYTHRERFRGEIVCLYMILYSIGRFLVEMLRNDPRGEVGIFSTSQFISFFVLAAGIALWIFFYKKNWSPLRHVGPFVRPDKKPKEPENVKEEEKCE